MRPSADPVSKIAQGGQGGKVGQDTSVPSKGAEIVLVLVQG